MQAPPVSEAHFKRDIVLAKKIIQQAISDGRSWLLSSEIASLLSAYGIATPKMIVTAALPIAAIGAAKKIGYPVVLKVDHDLIQHKTDIGGVILDIRNDQELLHACEQLSARLKETVPTLTIGRFCVKKMIDKSEFLELIVGSKVDSLFGPVIVFGQGGIAVEIIADRSIGIPPLNTILAKELIFRTRISKQMVSFRGRPPVDVSAITRVLVALSSMLVDIPELVELDINPLCAGADGTIALDTRVRISREMPGGVKNFAILPYPEDLVETVIWRSQEVTLRPIRPDDESQHRQFLQQLTLDDIRMRVFFTKRELLDTELARLTQPDYHREMVFIAERIAADGAKETLGTVRSTTDSENFSAEFAIVVRSDLHRQGLGNLLMEKLIRYARNKNLKQLTATILRENHSMRELAHKLGFVSDSAHLVQSESVDVILEIQGRSAQ